MGFCAQIGWFGLVIKWDLFYKKIQAQLLKLNTNRGESCQLQKHVSVLEQGDNRASTVNETNICPILEESPWSNPLLKHRHIVKGSDTILFELPTFFTPCKQT